MSERTRRGVPVRLDWVRGEPLSYIKCSVREAVRADWDGIRQLYRDAKFSPPSYEVLTRWTGQHKFVVRVVVRNQRHVVACCVSRHSVDESRITFVHALKQYEDWELEWRLLRLAAYELPERPVRMTVRHDDSWVYDLRDRGWRCVKSLVSDDGHDLYDFQFGPLVLVGADADGAVGRKKGQAPAGDSVQGRGAGGDGEAGGEGGPGV